MKIGIDARFVGPQGTGLGKYTEKLILNLAKIDQKNHYVIFLNKINSDSLKLPKNFSKVLADTPWYSVSEQIKMPKFFSSQNLDLLHVPHFNVPILYQGKFVVTIHDLIHHHFSEYAATTRNPIVFKLKRFAYRKVIENAIRKSQKIITPSNFVKEDTIKTFNINPDKIVVTYEAAEEEYYKTNYQLPASRGEPTTNLGPQSSLTRRGPHGTVYKLIYVGNAYPHKNLEKLLDAIKILTSNYQLPASRGEPTTNLIIVCPRDIFSKRLEDQIKSRKLENQVEVKGYLPAKELITLFQKATAYVFPSLSEGFGIPGLNAMSAGLPVVCANISVLKEIYGDTAIYFDPKDPKDIAKKIKETVSNNDLRSRLIDSGRRQAKKYSWLKMAKETLKVYESV